MKLDGNVTKRLVFIKYLHNIAVEQSKRPEILCSVSILTFHDAIELFLRLASEFLDVGKAQPSFIEYWDLLSQKLSERGLTQRESIRRLNKARVGLKHHGILPSKLDIEAFRASAANFFEENTPTVFKIEFSDISLIDLVQCEDTKNELKEAETMLRESRVEDALENVAFAFAQLIDDYESRKSEQYGHSTLFSAKSCISTICSTHSGFESDVESFADDVSSELEDIHKDINILSLNLNSQKYVKFRLLTPNVRILRGDPRRYYLPKFQRRSTRVPTMEDAQFCIDFVIESAVTLQELDF
jgi:hypothetical protein